MVTTAVEAAPAGFGVMPGVGAYGALQARRWAEQAAEAGAQSVLLLPPNAYRADREAVVDHYREVAEGRAADRRLQQPARHQGRPDARAAGRAARRGPHRRGQGVHRRRTPGLRDRRARPGARPAGRRRRRPARARPGRCGRLGRRLPERAAADLPGALPWSTSGDVADLDRRCRSTATLHPLLRWDSRTEFVQAIKLSMDLAGRKGGPCRPPRVAAGPRRSQAGRCVDDTEAALAKGYQWPTGSSPQSHADATGLSTPSTPTPRACRPG